jgi:hypothetical protein
MRGLDRSPTSFIARCAILLITSLTTAGARAQEPAPVQPVPCELDQPERVVDGHVFLAPAFMPSPFLSTHFSFRQGLTEVSISDFPITQDVRLDAEILGIAERIEAGVRFADRFELFGFGTGEVLSGASGRSVLAVGSDFSYAGGLGGRIRLFRSSRTGSELTAYAEGSAGRGGLLELLRLADAQADDPNPTVQSLANENLGKLVLGTTTRKQVTGRLLFAQSLGKNFDLQAGLGASYSNLSVELYNAQTNLEFERDFDSVDPEASVAIGANIAQVLPIGFLLEYTARSHRTVLASNEEDDWTPSHLIGLGVHTVHPNFQVGLTFARVMNLDRIIRTDPQTGQTLTSERPVVHYVQFGMDVVW